MDNYIRSGSEKDNIDLLNIADKGISVSSIIDAIGDPLSIQDRSFRVLYQNDSHKKLVGGSFIGEFCYSAYVSRGDVCPSCPVAMSFKDGCIHTIEKPGASDKGILCVEITASPLKDSSGKIIAGIEVVRDLTPRKESEIALQKAENEKRQHEAAVQRIQKLESISAFAGNIAHEYNNILTAIIGNLALAKMYAKPGYEVYDVLIEAEKASLRAKDLTTHLLSFAHDGMPIKKPALLSDLLHAAIQDSQFTERKIELGLSGGLWAVEIDETQLIQALGTLLKLPENQGCYISADNLLLTDMHSLPLANGRYVSLKIKIVPPMSDDLIGSIYDTSDSTNLSIGYLGLYSLCSIVEKNGGHLSIDRLSESGTVFNILLPAADDSNITLNRQSTVTPARKGKILVMDDEEIVRVVIKRLLLQCGFEAELVNDGAEMLKQYREAKNAGRSFSAVILDLIIQNGMGGKEAIHNLLDFDPNARVIVSSGYSNDPLMTNYRDYGFAGFLPKPYKIEELRNVLNDALAVY